MKKCIILVGLSVMISTYAMDNPKKTASAAVSCTLEFPAECDDHKTICFAESLLLNTFTAVNEEVSFVDYKNKNMHYQFPLKVVLPELYKMAATFLDAQTAVENGKAEPNTVVTTKLTAKPGVELSEDDIYQLQALRVHYFLTHEDLMSDKRNKKREINKNPDVQKRKTQYSAVKKNIATIIENRERFMLALMSHNAEFINGEKTKNFMLVPSYTLPHFIEHAREGAVASKLMAPLADACSQQ